jgi:hypothetical protein
VCVCVLDSPLETADSDPLIDPASSHEDNCAAMLDVAGFECTWRVRRYFCLTESVWQMLC